VEGLEPVVEKQVEDKPKEKPIDWGQFPGCIPDDGKKRDQRKKGDEPESTIGNETGESHRKHESRHQ